MPLTTVMLGQGEGFATHAEVTAAIGVECYFSLPHHSLVALLQRERERSAPFGALSELFIESFTDLVLNANFHGKMFPVSPPGLSAMHTGGFSPV